LLRRTVDDDETTLRGLSRTASNEPLIGLFGLLSIGAAFILGLRRRWNN
jgi:LPXTG-motif cell wall-anchored protein